MSCLVSFPQLFGCRLQCLIDGMKGRGACANRQRVRNSRKCRCHSGAICVAPNFLISCASLFLLPILKLCVGKLGCGSGKMPQNLHFVASNFGFRWRMFCLESRVWYWFVDHTSGQEGVWEQERFAPYIVIGHQRELFGTAF